MDQAAQFDAHVADFYHLPELPEDVQATRITPLNQVAARIDPDFGVEYYRLIQITQIMEAYKNLLFACTSLEKRAFKIGSQINSSRLTDIKLAFSRIETKIPQSASERTSRRIQELHLSIQFCMLKSVNEQTNEYVPQEYNTLKDLKSILTNTGLVSDYLKASINHSFENLAANMEKDIIQSMKVHIQRISKTALRQELSALGDSEEGRLLARLASETLSHGERYAPA